MNRTGLAGVLTCARPITVLLDAMKKETQPDLPPQSVLQAALCKTTERLARELASPGGEPPQWSNFEWLMARVVAATHGVSSLLASRLCWQGPKEWRQFLQDQARQTAARHAHIEELLRRIDQRARDSGIAVVALKGAELHAIGLYRGGERPMGDVDLLVRGADLGGMARDLQSLGFRATSSTWKHCTFVPEHCSPPSQCLGEHADNDLKIELHGRVGELLPVRPQDLTARLMPPQPHPGLNRYPSTASLMTHLLLHLAGGIVLRNVRLLQLHDVALLSLRMADADWDELLRLSALDGGYWWAWPPLALTVRYYPTAIPLRVLGAMETVCPWLLRRSVRRHTLSDVSLSHLPIEAFPGIEWSQTLPEALGYVVRRLLPGKEVVAGRAELVKTRGAAAASPWDQLSQWRRIVSWVTAPQSRSETLYPIRVALLEADASADFRSR
jgi:hypothetical protein